MAVVQRDPRHLHEHGQGSPGAGSAAAHLHRHLRRDARRVDYVRLRSVLTGMHIDLKFPVINKRSIYCILSVQEVLTHSI